jgi:hypothetical protein
VNSKTFFFASARLRYNLLLRQLAADGQNLLAAAEINDLCPLLGINAAWARDDLGRLRCGRPLKRLTKPS